MQVGKIKLYAIPEDAKPIEIDRPPKNGAAKKAAKKSSKKGGAK
jgi:hypothetical protein